MRRDSTWTYMYGRVRARVEETAIVKNVLASASVVCAHTATVHTHVTHNRPYCLAIAFQPSTVYGLARLLVLCHGVSPRCTRGRAYSRARENDARPRYIASRRATSDVKRKREDTQRGVLYVLPFVYLHNCGLAQFSCRFFQLIFHGILSQNYTAPPTTGRLDYLIIDDDDDDDDAARCA